jgi:hypothetical protein
MRPYDYYCHSPRAGALLGHAYLDKYLSHVCDTHGETISLLELPLAVVDLYFQAVLPETH